MKNLCLNPSQSFGHKSKISWKNNLSVHFIKFLYMKEKASVSISPPAWSFFSKFPERANKHNIFPSNKPHSNDWSSATSKLDLHNKNVCLFFLCDGLVVMFFPSFLQHDIFPFYSSIKIIYDGWINKNLTGCRLGYEEEEMGKSEKSICPPLNDIFPPCFMSLSQ
jgi:hypothetical protein